MNFKDIARNLLAHAARFLDSDADGKVEISDLPAALAKAAALQASGLALHRAGEASYQAIREVASAGSLTVNGQPATVEQVDAAMEQAKVPYRTAAAEARAELGAGGA